MIERALISIPVCCIARGCCKHHRAEGHTKKVCMFWKRHHPAACRTQQQQQRAHKGPWQHHPAVIQYARFTISVGSSPYNVIQECTVRPLSVRSGVFLHPDQVPYHKHPSLQNPFCAGLTCTCALAGKPDFAQTTVQQHLWTGHKATDLRMPACPQRGMATAAHLQLLLKEASESQWATTSRIAAETASQGATGGVCKREGCRCLTPSSMCPSQGLVSCTCTAIGRTAKDGVARDDNIEIAECNSFSCTGLLPKEGSPPR